MKYTILILVLFTLSCKQSKPVNVPYFKRGDTIRNRVVTDAYNLNRVAARWEQGFWDASERQMDSVFNVYTEPLK